LAASHKTGFRRLTEACEEAFQPGITPDSGLILNLHVRRFRSLAGRVTAQLTDRTDLPLFR
jgi:hypothetical protein